MDKNIHCQKYVHSKYLYTNKYLYIYMNIGGVKLSTNPDRCESGHGDKRHPTEKC